MINKNSPCQTLKKAKKCLTSDCNWSIVVKKDLKYKKSRFLNDKTETDVG